MSVALILRALANERRLQILEWLRDPQAHFPPQVDGDLVKDLRHSHNSLAAMTTL